MMERIKTKVITGKVRFFYVDGEPLTRRVRAEEDFAPENYAENILE